MPGFNVLLPKPPGSEKLNRQFTITAVRNTLCLKYFVLFVVLSFRCSFRFVLQISNFNWPGLGPASERRSAPTGRNGGRPRRCPSPGQLKFEILKLRIESSENGPKRSETIQNGPKTVRNGLKTIRNRPKRSENNPKASDMVRNGQTVRNRPKRSETV